MPYAKIPKDLTKYESKLVLNLTKRQVICYLVAGILGISIFFITKKYLGADLGGWLTIIVVSPIFALSLGRFKNNLPFEKYVALIIRTRVVSTFKRPYQSSNMYRLLERPEVDLYYICQQKTRKK